MCVRPLITEYIRSPSGFTFSRWFVTVGSPACFSSGLRHHIVLHKEPPCLQSLGRRSRRIHKNIRSALFLYTAPKPRPRPPPRLILLIATVRFSPRSRFLRSSGVL